MGRGTNIALETAGLGDAGGDDSPRRMYLRVLANWAGDVLTAKPRAAWPAADPEGDFRDRNWRKLYAGSVLDD